MMAIKTAAAVKTRGPGFYALALLCACAPFFLLAPESAAQFGHSAKDQVFDYNPDDGTDTPQLATAAVTVEYDAEVVSDRKGGVIMYTKDRWRNWVVRSVYILIIDIALLAIILSLPKNEEFYIIVAYVLCGASTVLSFWVFLCAVLLFMLRAAAWTYILPLSGVMTVMTAVLLLKIKYSDVSLTELKESFQKLSANSNEDRRLLSVEGGPGDWPEKDFMQ